ncbi:hypothetical protein GJR96_00040 [Haloferax sp. MBLA0076]|uniref:Uncharacterized protein n=1 Tax=Haloferax litoreum TaxID=2666140 RepID=A0A6A8GB62_9EURY|nr:MULTISPECIES: hypothetical protein [Haloferax]KAB1191911.1 hypothetical protein Hfx1148_00040 [Haloferax sp. CBA1148]MRX20348.1 hypothetical protein [Haloferax litoreum]
MSDRRRDDDILDVLDELGETLDELGSELREERDREVRDRFRNPRPPTFGEVMRFTESYTLPTIIAVLEATIASLELLRRLIRLSDPGRVMEDRRTESDIDVRMREVPRTAVYGVERALDELRKALSEADLPSNSDARDIMEHARSLADELDARITDAERERTSRERHWRDEERRFESSWRRRSDARGRDSGPVRIDVTEEGSENVANDADGESDDTPQVDVEAELESIKREVKGDDEDDEEPSDY